MNKYQLSRYLVIGLLSPTSKEGSSHWFKEKKKETETQTAPDTYWKSSGKKMIYCHFKPGVFPVENLFTLLSEQLRLKWC